MRRPGTTQIARADSTTIVVGVDRSEPSEAAFRWARREAELTGRSLAIIHAIRPDEDPDSARKVVATMSGRARRRGVPASAQVVEGDASEVLVAAASHAAMLVVGTHGRSPLAVELLGSVSQGCVRATHGPIVVIPASQPVAG